MDSNTVHRSDGSTIREINSGAVTYEWEIVDSDQEDSLDGYQYADGDPSEAAFDALESWIAEFHNDDETAE